MYNIRNKFYVITEENLKFHDTYDGQKNLILHSAGCSYLV